jgi:hypothetical protein
VALFGKRKVPVEAVKEDGFAPPPHAPDPTSVPPSAQKVIVKSSAVASAKSGKDFYPLISSVINFVNTALDEHQFTRQEIAQKALQVYHTDYYLAQVNNGGHSQFIHNSRRNAEYINRDAFDGLTAMHAPHVTMLRDLMIWVVKNPQDAALQNGFSNRAPYLDDLDKALGEAEKQSSMINLSAMWVLSWPELQIVSDEQYAEEMRIFGEGNRKYADRKSNKTVLRIMADSVDNFKVTVGLLLTSLESREVLLGTGKGSYKEIEGRKEMSILIQTHVGKRLVVVNSGDAAKLYEYFDPDNDKLQELVRTLGYEKAFEFQKSKEYRHPKIGCHMASVSNSIIEQLTEASVENMSGLGIACLLHQIGELETAQGIVPLPVHILEDGKKLVRWLAIGQKSGWVFDTYEGGAVVKKMDETDIIAKCSRAEMMNFLDESLSKAALKT